MYKMKFEDYKKTLFLGDFGDLVIGDIRFFDCYYRDSCLLTVERLFELIAEDYTETVATPLFKSKAKHHLILNDLWEHAEDITRLFVAYAFVDKDGYILMQAVKLINKGAIYTQEPLTEFIYRVAVELEKFINLKKEATNMVRDLKAIQEGLFLGDCGEYVIDLSRETHIDEAIGLLADYHTFIYHCDLWDFARENTGAVEDALQEFGLDKEEGLEALFQRAHYQVLTDQLWENLQDILVWYAVNEMGVKVFEVAKAVTQNPHDFDRLEDVLEAVEDALLYGFAPVSFK